MSEPVPESTPGTQYAARSGLRHSLAACFVIVAAAALTLYLFYSRGLTNLYGDGIAHMEGARRLLDSLTPGYAEIGTVWLPLYHLLVAPLAVNDFLWRSGLGGSLVSEAAFAVAAWFIYRLALEMNRSRASAWVALAAFLLCPSMMYLASTPLAEPLTLLLAVLTVYGLFRYRESGAARALLGAAVAAFSGTLARYDGWFLLPFAALQRPTALRPWTIVNLAAHPVLADQAELIDRRRRQQGLPAAPAPVPGARCAVTGPAAARAGEGPG